MFQMPGFLVSMYLNSYPPYAVGGYLLSSYFVKRWYRKDYSGQRFVGHRPFNPAIETSKGYKEWKRNDEVYQINNIDIEG